MSWYRRSSAGWVLNLHVQPGAKQTAVVGVVQSGQPGKGPSLKLRVPAPALEGRANAAVLRFIAKTLDLPGQSVQLLRGEHSRDKQVLITQAEIEPQRLLQTRDND